MSVELRFALSRAGFALDTDLQLPGRGVTAVFGPSGSGKTTLLRCIAGLERIAGGRLVVNDEVWQGDDFFMPVHRRALGYVFQEASLFPHLTVKGNLDYGAKRCVRTDTVATDWDGIIHLLGIGHLLPRRPENLSGGERQRVAIARALLAAPRLLLLDEPLAALDHQRKREILPYLERLHDALAIPIIYVSHASDEVARLADHLVLLEQGRVLASGPLVETLARIDLPAAADEDAGVVLDVVVGAHDDDYHLTRLDFPGGAIWATKRELSIGSHARLRIHARDVSIALQGDAGSSILNRLPARVAAMARGGNPAQVIVQLDASGTLLLARITRRSRDQLGLVVGMQVWAQIKSVALLS